jgi:selenocysteine lyase/cysteine desulfurase
VAGRTEGRGLSPCATRAPGPRRRRHRQLGYGEGSTFAQRIEKQGTQDPAAWLAVPDAIRRALDLSMRLFTQHRIEISVAGTDRDLLRLSVASYTTRDEIDRLLAALARELDAEHGQQDE